MTRQKVKIAYIENETSRKSTYKKRKRGLLKKAYELATLCDVPLAIIIESEYDLSPEVYPSREAVEKVVSQWQMLSVMDKTKNMMNQETYLQQRISKATESLRKIRKENRELAMKEVMFDCISGKTSPSCVEKNDLRDFGCVIDKYLRDLNHRIEILMKNDGSSSSSTLVVAATTSVPMPIVESGSSSAGLYNMIPEQIQNNLNMKQTINDLDLNQKQW